MSAAQAAAVLRAMVLAASPPGLSFVANDAKLLAQLTNNLTTARGIVHDFVLQSLVPMRAVLRALPRPFEFPDLRKMQVDLPVGASPACNSVLPAATPSRMDHKFGRFHQFSIRDAERRFEEFIGGMSWHDPPATPREALQQYREFVQLRAMYIRLSAAVKASAEAGTSLSAALALYRTEGDLVAPLPLDHIAPKMLPPTEERFDFFFTPALKVELLPAMQHGLWAWNKPVIDARIASIDPNILVSAVQFERWAKFLAFLDWCLIVWGSDYLSKRVGAAAGGAFIAEYLRFSETIRGAAPGARTAAFDALLASLDLSEIDGFVVVAPRDPAGLVAYILAEGLLFSKLSGKAEVDGPFFTPVPALRYLAHHASDTRHHLDPKKDKFS